MKKQDMSNNTTKPASIAKQIITKNCIICNKEFELSYNQKLKFKKDNNAQFVCSKECKAIWDKRRKTLERPKLYCCICGKELDCTDDRFSRYRKGETQFYCKSCNMKNNNTKINLESRNETIRNNFKNEEYKNKVVEKRKITNMKLYGVDNPFKDTNKLKQYWIDNFGVTNPSQLSDVAAKKVITSKNSVSSDGKCFDSSYELYVYEFCKRNNIPIETQIPIEFTYEGKIHRTLIDFKIDDILFECKGGHLLTGVFSDRLEVPIQQKLEIYKQNHVVLITDTIGSDVIPHKESDGSNGLKYLNKCPNPLIGVDIELFKKPTFPYSEDKPRCFYDVKVNNKRSASEAWKDELLRWKLIKNRINYVGGFIDSKEILNAMNVTRVCKQPSWFSKTYAKDLIKRYITTDIILDPFAGWGTRCDACKELNIKYYGWDLNKELVDWHHKQGRIFSTGYGIEYGDANNIKTDRENCSIFICPPYQNIEIYFDNQNIEYTQCEWLNIVMKNIPNAKEYLMVCKVVDKNYEKYIVDTKINKSHFGTNKEYVILINQNQRKELLNML